MDTRMARKVARLRRKRKWTQAELAAEAGVSQSLIAYIETGERTPSVATLKKLAKALDVGIEEIVE